MAKDPDERYATTVELADAACEAITVPIQRPTPSPVGGRSTEPTPPTADRTSDQATAVSNFATTQHSGPADSQANDGERTGAVSTVWWRQRRPALIAGAIVVLLTVAGTTGYLVRRPSDSRPATTAALPSTTAANPTTTTPAGPPPIAEPALNGLLLTPAEINAAMGATGMTVFQPWDNLQDPGVNPSTPPECLPVGGCMRLSDDGSGDRHRRPDCRKSTHLKLFLTAATEPNLPGGNSHSPRVDIDVP